MTVYYKMRQILQNVTATLSQNATEVHYKIRQVFCYSFIYKMRQLLQNATFTTNCDSAVKFTDDMLQIIKFFKTVVKISGSF